MKKGLCIYLLCTAWSLSQVETPLDSPPEPAAEQSQLEQYKQKYPGADAVFLSYEDHFRHIASKGVAANWQLKHQVKRSYLLINNDNENLTTFKVRTYKDQDLKDVQLKVIYPSGKEHEITKKGLQHTKENDTETYQVIYSGTEPGCIIEEEFLIVDNKPYLTLEMSIQHSLPCENMHASISYPSYWNARVKRIAVSQPFKLEETIDDDHDITTLTYKKDFVPAYDLDEPYSAPVKWYSNYVLFHITQLHFGGRNHVEPQNWAEFGAKFKDYVMDRKAKFSSLVKKTAASITRNSKSDLEKYKAIVKYVQDEFQLGESFPKNYAKMIKKKTGNYLAMTGLAHRLLTASGIEADFLLIHSAYDGYFDWRFYVYSEMNIPAVMAIIDGEAYVTLPYIKNLPPEHIPRRLQGQPAIKISEKGFAKRSKVPIGNHLENKTEEFYDLKLQEDGTILVEERKVFHGSEAYYLRRELEDISEEETEELLADLLTYSDGEIGDKKQEIIGLEAFGTPLEIKLSYQIDNLLSVMPDEVIFQTAGLFSPVSSQKTKVVKAERKNPIWIPYDQKTTKHIAIQFPENWAVQTVPQNQEISNKLGSLKAQYESKTGSLEIHQELNMNKTIERKAFFPVLLELLGTQNSFNIPTMVFEIR